MLRFALTLCCVSVGALGWINNYDQPEHFQCRTGQFLSHINSIHHNHYEDRRWNFGCSPLPLGEAISRNCSWTGYVNAFDQPLTFQCPADGFITGMDSVHDNHYEDRRFKFQCCQAPDAIPHACYFTDWENSFDGILDFRVPQDKILRGINSYHQNHYEDRRFKFEICSLDYLGKK
ncbi:hypothetical protein ACOMHN_021782 [Nucella lapillus]